MLRKQIEKIPPIMREIPMQQSRNLQNRDIATWILDGIQTNDKPLVMHLIGESRLAIEGKMNIFILADLYMIAIVIKKMKKNMKVDLSLSKFINVLKISINL